MWLAGESILLTLWIGSLWCIGYLVAPVLFASLEDRALAGTIAGQMFTAGAVVGIATGVLWLGIRRLRGVSLISVSGLLALTCLLLLAVGEFIVHPMASAARAGGSDSFGRWHGLASLLWLGASVAGLALIVVQGRTTRGLSGLPR